MEGLGQALQKEICELGKQYNLKTIILFGSRARGDNHIRSDIDIAVSGGDVVGFALAVEEDVNTLLKFDVVNLDGRVQPELIYEIQKEGKVLYEKI